MELNEPKHSGAEVTLSDGTTLVVPAFSLGKFEDLEASGAFDALANPSDNLKERLKLILPLFLAALNRNYPQLTADVLKADLDLPSLKAIEQAILKANGMKVVAVGETLPAAE
jgi:hypothetical protein